MIRTLGGIAVGLAAAIVLMMITEGLGNQIAPPPARLDLQDLTETPPLPPLTLLFPIIGWFAGALVGGWLAIRISKVEWTAWAVAGVVFLATLVNFLFLAYPLWALIAGLVGPIFGGWLARRLCAVGDRASG